MTVWQRSPLFGCPNAAGAESEIQRVKVGRQEDRAAELRRVEGQAVRDYLSAKGPVGRPRWSRGLVEKPRRS